MMQGHQTITIHKQAMPALSNAKHEVFCQEYMKDRNAKQAATRAGYSKSNAHATGYDLLRRPEVKARIAELTAAYMAEVGVRNPMAVKTIAGIEEAE